jgi:creatinine amidohydrolase
VLPTGATEQHGPHLPCAVDTVISAGVVGHALAKLGAEVPAYAMAPITYGKSEEHLHFPGTITLTGETLLATMNEIGESVYRAGFRKLLIVNGHGGQPQIMEIMAREMRLRHGDYIVVPQHTWRLPHVAGRYMSDKEKKLAMHAGHAETAIMMALAPDTVHMEHAVANYPPEFACKTLSSDGRPAAAWTARDFGPSGVIGDPLPATAEQGHAILESLAESWARGISELHALKWVERDAQSWGRSHMVGDIEST